VAECKHENARTKRYVGSDQTYQFCPDCWETFGGEESPAKKKLIAEAAKAQELFGSEVED
jgi:hypothetical protein